MKTAVIYTRVSTEEQAKEGLSLDFQINLLRKYCAMQNIEIYHEFVEEGKSAKTFNRPKFQELLKYIKKNRKVIDYVLFSKWDRFSRNATDALNMIRDLRDMGIEPQAVQQPIDFSIPQNKFMLVFYLTEPEVNNDVRAQATKEGLRRRLEKGGWVTHPPVGYEAARSAENLPTLRPGPKSRFVKEAFEMIVQGHTQKNVRKFLRANNCPHSKNYVQKILTNRIYIGEIYIPAYKKEAAKTVRGLHEPIIDGDLFRRVQNILMAKAGSRTKRQKFHEGMPLRGHLQCKRCGGNLTGSASRSHTGRQYFYYHCRGACKERIAAHEANEAFTKYLERIKPQREVVALYQAIMEDMLSSQGDSSENRLRQVEKEIAEIKSRLFKTDELLVDGVLPPERYEVVSGKYRKQLAALETEAEDLQMVETSYMKYIKFGFHVALNLDSFYNWLDVEGKQKFLGSIFPHKVVYMGEGKCRTPKANEVIALFCGLQADFEDPEKAKAAFKSSFCEMGTQERSRTFTSLRTLRPERSASTNSATWAWGMQR